MREEIDGHTTIGGGAVIRINKEALEGLAKSFNRLQQTFLTAGPEIQRLVEVFQDLNAALRTIPDPAHLGMTPDGGYKEPEEVTAPLPAASREIRKGSPGPY